MLITMVYYTYGRLRPESVQKHPKFAVFSTFQAATVYKENFPGISELSYVEKVAFRAILASTSNFWHVMTKTALKTNFSAWDGAEILGKFCSYIEENFPKISASSYVKKVVSESYFSSG